MGRLPVGMRPGGTVRVYGLDRATGGSAGENADPVYHTDGFGGCPPELTPDGGALWVAYTNEEPYVRDNPNGEVQFELTFRDRTLLHRLTFRNQPDQGYCRTNGFLVEMTYVEELDALEDATQLHNVEWRIAFPTSTDRQVVRSVEPVGYPYTEIKQNGERVASYKFETLSPHERHIFGWKALVEVYGIKYQLTPPPGRKRTTPAGGVRASLPH